MRKSPPLLRFRSALFSLALGLVLGTALPVDAAPARPARSAAFPDSVLARVDGGDLTQRQLEDALRRMGADPDSTTREQRREVLELLIEQRILAQRARSERWTWTPSESLAFDQLRDRLTISAALDSALRAHRADLTARQRPVPGPEDIGTSVRDSAVARWAPVWNEPLLLRLYRAWQQIPKPDSKMSVMQQIGVMGAMPQVSAEDSLLWLVRSAGGDLTAGDVLIEWRRLNPLHRPRVEEVEPMRDVAKNVLFESHLRHQAVRQQLERRPDIAARLEEQREFIAVRHFVQREIYDTLPADSLTLERHYRARLADWWLPGSARVFQMVLSTREGAEQLLERVRTAAQVETLLVRWNQRDDPRRAADFIRTVSDRHDSVTYARARQLGVGALIGPEALESDPASAGASGWRILRVMDVQEKRLRTFEEARTLVHKDWTERESERRMRALLDRLARTARVERSPRWPAPRATRGGRS